MFCATKIASQGFLSVNYREKSLACYLERVVRESTSLLIPYGFKSLISFLSWLKLWFFSYSSGLFSNAPFRAYWKLLCFSTGRDVQCLSCQTIFFSKFVQLICNTKVICITMTSLSWHPCFIYQLFHHFFLWLNC